MKRDPELCRSILRALEENRSGEVDRRQVSVEGRQWHEVWHHLELLADAGLVSICESDEQLYGGYRMYVRLTNDGHEFLSLSRNESTWRKAKDFVLETTGDVALVLLRGTLTDMGKKAIERGLKAMGYET